MHPSPSSQLLSQVCTPVQVSTHPLVHPVIWHSDASSQLKVQPPSGQSSTHASVSEQWTMHPPPAQPTSHVVLASHCAMQPPPVQPKSQSAASAHVN